VAAAVKWVLIIYITADLWIGTYAFDSPQACEEALAQWEFQPGAHGMCVEATVENSKKPRAK
jgi:hypothetical protein